MNRKEGGGGITKLLFLLLLWFAMHGLEERTEYRAGGIAHVLEERTVQGRRELRR